MQWIIKVHRSSRINDDVNIFDQLLAVFLRQPKSLSNQITLNRLNLGNGIVNEFFPGLEFRFDKGAETLGREYLLLNARHGLNASFRPDHDIDF